jgi:hypothetical protein
MTVESHPAPLPMVIAVADNVKTALLFCIVIFIVLFTHQ